MRKNLLISEALTSVHNATNDEDRKKILKNQETPGLLSILRYAFCPSIVFDCGIPDYNPSVRPAGTDYASLQAEARKLYIFTEDYQKVTAQRKRELLLQILESINMSEARVVAQVLQKKLTVNGLTPELVESVFPGLLATKEGAQWIQYKKQVGSSQPEQPQTENESSSSKAGLNTLTQPNQESNGTKSETKQRPVSRSRRVIT